MDKDGEKRRIDIAAYAAQIAALLGAHIIKIKLSTDHLSLPEAKKVYESEKIDIATQAARVRHCVTKCFGRPPIDCVLGWRGAKGADAVYDDARLFVMVAATGQSSGERQFVPGGNLSGRCCSRCWQAGGHLSRNSRNADQA